MPSTSVRPLRNTSIDKLEEMAKQASRDVTTRQVLVHELGFRKTKRAQKLLAKLERMNVASGEGIKGRGSKATSVHPQRKSSTQSKSPARPLALRPPLPTECAPSGLEARYAQLRDLVGLDAEELARWGLVPEAPNEIMRLVFDAWTKRVTETPDLYGRCSEALRVVRERFEA